MYIKSITWPYDTISIRKSSNNTTLKDNCKSVKEKMNINDSSVPNIN
jgi:hypothetical protein